MNERLVEACLRYAAAVRELADARAEMTAARAGVTPVTPDTIEAQMQTGLGVLETPTEALADQSPWEG